MYRPVIVCLACLAIACNTKHPLFELVPVQQSAISFDNRITENDTINPFDVTNMYNGAGVGIGDFNNDGLPDIYFAGNQVPCQLYLNKGGMKFEDITATANVNGNGKWCRGVSVVDINNDGKPDIYVCATIYADPERRKNLLYINQGNNEAGVPVFTEEAAAYGLDDDSHSTMASFFDYDNDGDLDVYITVNEIVENSNPSAYRKPITDGSWPSTGRLYRNDGNKTGHAHFTNVSKEAGITIEGYGHSACITDINRDGWKDIFVANDFLSNDILYINNHDGTFTDRSASYFKHTSANGMGSDMIDINNDGLADLVEMDMDPADNYRKKVLMSGYNYLTYQNNDFYGYQYQYVRNTLQVNQGSRVNGNDSIGEPVFADLAFYAGISSTDWSWAPVVQDFNNDGWRDIVITNGFPKDLTDHDFMAFREKSFANKSKREVLAAIPEVRIRNYAFRNNRQLGFDNMTTEWGLKELSFSNGAAYADFDNDGDLDLVVSNINDKAFLYENHVKDKTNDSTHFLAVRLSGDSLNRQALGAWVEIYYGNQKQVIENSPYRGFLSTVQQTLHFGLGNIKQLDSVLVIWPDQQKQVLTRVPADQTLQLDYQKASAKYDWQQPMVDSAALFKDITDSVALHYVHRETDFIDFNVQKLIPHKLSEYTPAIATGDLNNDGLDDLVIGASFGSSPVLLFQQPSGKFEQKKLFAAAGDLDHEVTSIALFDADGDHDLDMYLAYGSNEAAPGTAAYQDKLLINDGRGQFTVAAAAIPQNYDSKSVVRVADFDKDGDLDLFIGGRCYPWNYPKAVSGQLLRNDTKNGRLLFTDVTDSIAKDLKDIGMLCDAVWADYDKDGWPDLVLAGEWMPITILHNEQGKFSNATANSGLADKTGWWNSIVTGDFDGDGDDDFIVGNLGENSFYKASAQYPVSIYAKDFYKQGTTQCLVTLYLKENANGQLKEFTAHNRDDVVEQLPFIKKRFLTYADFGKASFDKLFTPDEMKGMTRYSATWLGTSFLRNNGQGKFSLELLPAMTQFSAVNAMVVDDFDKDGHLDVCMNTNDFGTDPANGRYDALNGLVLRGDGKGGFQPLSIAQSGVFIPGCGRGLAKLKGSRGQYLLAVTQNRGALKLLELKK